jgi:Flp pilus assembly pilin Flp
MNFFTLTYARLRPVDGQTMTEMAVLLALVVLVVFGAVAIFSQSLSNLWSDLSSQLPGG